MLLGALHGLEPGHSKTMMAAFIIAVRGTVMQAILLGLAATVSNTAFVWGVALVGMRLGSQWNAETTEPYFQVASAVLIICIAAWMIWRTWRERRRAILESHDYRHGHRHGEEVRRIDTGHGVLALEVFEGGVPPRWRTRAESGHDWAAQAVTVETETERNRLRFPRKRSFFHFERASQAANNHVPRTVVGSRLDLFVDIQNELRHVIVPIEGDNLFRSQSTDDDRALRRKRARARSLGRCRRLRGQAVFDARAHGARGCLASALPAGAGCEPTNRR
jgi:ABC-type nickel/cobalt efflux system permease component RcnA